MGCSLSVQRSPVPETGAKGDPGGSSSALGSPRADQLTASSSAQTNSASSRDSGLSFGGKQGSANTPLLASPGGSQRRRDEAVNERFSSALDVLKETLQVPVARISLAESAQRLLWFNAGSVGKTVMVVNDTMKHARFKGALFVPWPPLTRFYAAAPLVCSEGRVLGSLELLDSKPRTFRAGALDVLRSFSAMIARDVERGEAEEWHSKDLVDAALLVRKHTVRALSCFPEAVLLVDVASDDKWPIAWVNDRFVYETGVPERSCLCSGFWDLFSAVSGGDSRARTAQGIRERQPFVVIVAGGEEGDCMLLEFRPATIYHLTACAPAEGDEALKDGLDASTVDAMNASFYFGVVKEARRHQPGKQQELQHAQYAATLQRPSAAGWEMDERFEPLSPLARPLQHPGHGLSLPGDAQREQWQHQQQQEAKGQFVSPFQARWRQLGEGLQQWPEEDEGAMHQVVPQATLPWSQQPAPRAQQLPRRHSMDVRRSIEHQAGMAAGASVRRSMDYQRQAALWQQQAARGAGQLAPRGSLDLPAQRHLAPRGSLDSQAQKQLAGSLQEWGGASPRTVTDLEFAQLSSAATLESEFSATPTANEVPEALKDVKLGRILGRGGFGAVYRGTWRGADVAVKVIKTRVDPASAELAAPMLEGLLSKNLNHPNIVQTYEFGLKTAEVPGDSLVEPQQSLSLGGALEEVWIVQQYCNHGTLADAIVRGWLRIGGEPTGPPNLKHILETAQEVSSALLYLHRQDVLHGDLTAANVLLAGVRHRGRSSRTFQCKVADFGLSRFMEAAQLTTATVGTVSHMPMELIASGRLSKAVDVFAFGTLCWEMYMGRRAWAGRCIAQILFARTEAKERLALPEDAPPGFKRLVESCLDEDSSQRPSFDEIIHCISTLLAAQEASHAAV